MSAVVTPVAQLTGDGTGTRSPAPRRRSRLGALRHVVLVPLALASLFPILLIVSTALRPARSVTVDPFGFFDAVSVENIATAWTTGRFGEYVGNSFALTVPATLLVLLVSVLAGYAFARLPFPGRGALFGMIVIGLLVPFFTYMIPLYFQLKGMGLLDTYLGAVLLLATGVLPFGVFFMRAFFTDLPSELEQSARVDGCSEWQIFWRVMLPLVLPGVGTLAVFAALQTWNNFLIPLLFLPGGSFRPLTTGLYLFVGGRTIDVGPLAAGTLITILPIVVLFIVLQRQVVSGFLSGAVKG